MVKYEITTATEKLDTAVKEIEELCFNIKKKYLHTFKKNIQI